MNQERFKRLLNSVDSWNQSSPAALSFPAVKNIPLCVTGWEERARIFPSIKVKVPLNLRCTEKYSDPLTVGLQDCFKGLISHFLHNGNKMSPSPMTDLGTS